ncbi:MAG: hypothetical protein LBH70_06160 [Spirochaetaceae bacterium]|jgi:hypothetical protein|nr:hypothetical protein [Spirochaetaceae bacterium]
MIEALELQEESVQELPETLPEKNEQGGPGDEFYSSKIYCANCAHCKLVPVTLEEGGRYVLRVRCAAGKWRKKLGEEKMYKYCTIIRRYLDECGAYEEMGDAKEFIRELRRTIPGKDEQYVLFQNDGPVSQEQLRNPAESSDAEPA